MGQVHRTTFARQAAKLWKMKERLWKLLRLLIHFGPALSLVDSFPMPVCRFARAYRCRRLAGAAAFGHDEMSEGFLFEADLLRVARLPRRKLAQGNYRGRAGPGQHERLPDGAPYTRPAHRALQRQEVWARDRWHVYLRWMRKVASHTMTVLLCRCEGLSPLRFSELITD